MFVLVEETMREKNQEIESLLKENTRLKTTVKELCDLVVAKGDKANEELLLSRNEYVSPE